MASPRPIDPVATCRYDDKTTSSYGRPLRFQSTSYESIQSNLSLGSRDVIVADQWVILGKIGEGSFGEIFEARDINTHRHYAIKRERRKTSNTQLRHENMMYDVLAGGSGIPQCHWYGHFDGFNCIVMDLLGCSLGQLRENVSCMELDIAVDLACQMISIVEHIHDCGVILRDVKPDNFLFGASHNLHEIEMHESWDDCGIPMTTYKKPTCKQVFTKLWAEKYPKLYAVDFGLTCYWRDPDTGLAYPDSKKLIRDKTGTARYASINVHRGKLHSRRDDMESIGYILLDLILGTLPWAGVHAKNYKAGWDKIQQLKVDTPLIDLCSGLPKGLLVFIEYSRSLQYTDQPNYEKIRQFLHGCLPGGAYSDVVESPPTIDRPAVIDTSEQGLKQHHVKKRSEHQYPAHPFEQISKDDDDHGLFAMDDIKQQLSTVIESQQHEPKNATLSRNPSLKKSSKQIKSRKVGWNTHKRDVTLSDFTPEWTND